MQRIMIVLTLLGVACLASAQLDSQDFQKQSTNARASSNNNPPPPLYPFSTYPDYSSNAMQPKHESVPRALALQRTFSPWSFGSIVSNLMPVVSHLSLYSSRVGTILLQVLMTAFLSTGIASLICTYTTYCSFLGLNNEVKKQVSDLARSYMTPENLRLASLLVTEAIDKYSVMENEEETDVKKDVTEEELTKESTTQ